MLRDQKTLPAHELLDKISKDQTVKNIEWKVPFNKDISLHDLSLNAKGMDEDQVYAKDRFLVDNIRRGNTIVQIKKEGQVKACFVARRGLKKFFDLQREYIQYNIADNNEPLVVKHGKSSDEFLHQNLHQIIFAEIERALRNEPNTCVHVYKLEKANGENCQISYIENKEEGDIWVIASKNVSLAARKVEDLDAYKDRRFQFAKLIGQEWFKILAGMTQIELSSLASYLKGKTFVGEYCGNQDYQHLVRYKEVNLLFYAVVENNSFDTCTDPEEAYKIFEKFGLKHVKKNEILVTNSFRVLNTKLLELHDKVAASSVEEEQEGVVLYFVLERTVEKQKRVVSLCKVKTIEYRIYRKLREKLKTYITKLTLAATSVIDSFIDETRELCRHASPPKPIEFYRKVAEACFVFAVNHINHHHLIHDKYITFLNLILECVETGKSLHPGMFTEGKEDNNKSGATIEETKPKNSKVFEKRNPNANKILFVFVPLTIPGTGKTYFFNAIEKKMGSILPNVSFTLLSSDKIREEVMKKISASNPRLSKDECFERSGKDARDIFFRRLGEAVKNSQNSKGNVSIIYIDKNHPPNAISGTEKILRQSTPKNVELKIVALVPKIYKPFTYSKFRYPFSLNYILTCFNRVQNRKEHETLVGNSVESAKILVFFTQMFRNQTFTPEDLEGGGIFDMRISINFTDEDPNSDDKLIKNHKNLMHFFQEVMDSTMPNKHCENIVALKEFTKVLEDAKLGNNFLPPVGVENECSLLIEEIIEAIKGFDKEMKIESVKNVNKNENLTTTNNLKRKADNNNLENYLLNSEGKSPIFIGFFSVDEEASRSVAVDMIRTHFKFLNDQMQDNLIIKSLMHSFAKEHNFPHTLHVTSLFIGNQLQKKGLPGFKLFELGKKFEVQINALLIVPKKIITAFFLNSQKGSFPSPVENKFPHITLMVGEWQPKMSNDILIKVFEENEELKNLYEGGSLESDNELAVKLETNMRGKTETVFISKIKKGFTFSLESKAFYGK